MNYSSPFCPDDDKILTKDGKMKISKLYYKMNPKRDPYNKILDVQNFIFSKCVSINKDKLSESKLKKQKSLKDIRDMNEYYNNMNKIRSHTIINPEDIPYYNNDNSNIFQTALKICSNTNIKNSTLDKINSRINQTNDNSKISSNIIESSFNINQSNKQKSLIQSHSYIIKLDRTYYKSPNNNRKIYILNKNRRETEKNQGIFRINKYSTICFNDSDMSKYSEIIPLSRQNYLNDQFNFDNSARTTLTHLKQYQIRETQNKAKIKPFVY